MKPNFLFYLIYVFLVANVLSLDFIFFQRLKTEHCSTQ
ncbi:hypothetical protein LEP1GSC202_4004 [Leptospira yanagawae serovar Saopaulo str. Sao Paulo = ATCC 700523]|uniref:Uncharacterized protein n=1 Tax=Leptospira yanagawae serovar Saopaulo str. Sao Paulo = ATCC 700523 TaxID=1249483 RepID=A0A5E8HIE6_9LEPT|nr:hypothetical protein LEP1GSC202_4004 [Leptospira yanagawae serovar Saopaulo str. Sao Paulo = ATCC 700523]